MLESIGINITVGQGFIRNYIIIERDKFHFQIIFFFRYFFGDFSNFLLWSIGYSHSDKVGVIFPSRTSSKEKNSGSQ